jgi:hypothetical protein
MPRGPRIQNFSLRAYPTIMKYAPWSGSCDWHDFTEIIFGRFHSLGYIGCKSNNEFSFHDFAQGGGLSSDLGSS